MKRNSDVLICKLTLQVACLEEEIETLGNQMGNLGVEIVPYEMSDPYFAALSEYTSNCMNQPGLPVLHSDNALVNQDWCSYMELQLPRTEDETSQGSFNSNIYERLLQELNQENYLHDELSQDYYLQ